MPAEVQNNTTCAWILSISIDKVTDTYLDLEINNQVTYCTSRNCKQFHLVAILRD